MKKILILLPDIWSMEKYQGMPSIHNFVLKASTEFKCVVFTTDNKGVDVDYPNAEVYVFNKIKNNSKNRYIQYLVARINFIFINLYYIYKSMRVEFKPDIIYCSSSVPSLAGRVLKSLFKAKLINRIYGTFLYDNIDSNFDKLKKYEECLSFYFKADKYIITNDGTRGNIVANKFNIPEDKVEFLINGVNIEPNPNQMLSELREKFLIPKEHLIAISVSRLSSWKRVDRIIKAFNDLSTSNISLIVIGDGPQRAEWETLKINKNIHFVGSLPAISVHSIMNDSDLFVSMYDYSNVGNPLLEALSYGLAIIALSSGGTKDIIQNDVNGILIDNNQTDMGMIKDLTAKIRLLIRKPELRNNLSLQAIDFSRKNISSWDDRIDREIDIIKEL